MSGYELLPCRICNVPAKFGNTNYVNPFVLTGQHTNGPTAEIVGCPKCFLSCCETEMTEYASRLARKLWVINEWNKRNAQ